MATVRGAAALLTDQIVDRVGPVRDHWALRQSILVLVEDALAAAKREGIEEARESISR